MQGDVRVGRVLVGSVDTWAHLSARAVGNSVSLNRVLVRTKTQGIATEDELMFMTAGHARALANQLIAAADQIDGDNPASARAQPQGNGTS